MSSHGSNSHIETLARMMPNVWPIFFKKRQPLPIQADAMPLIVRGQSVLMCGPTASGKTEAAIAPIYQRHLSFRRKILSVLHIAPTKALVNDLNYRIKEYFGGDFLGKVKRYTGDHHELDSIDQVFMLLTTPEALDSLQLMRPEKLIGIRAIIIDEIHFLHGFARGQQLRHVINRIKSVHNFSNHPKDNFQIVGMSATINDAEDVANIWLGKNSSIVASGEHRQIIMNLVSTELGKIDEIKARAKAIVSWLEHDDANKILVFSNSRNGAHGLAAWLQNYLNRTKWTINMHIGILSKSERERVEDSIKRDNFVICVATSTLEIGIDIGDIDTVVLAKAPTLINSFLQRIGRGNRRSGICKVVAIYGSSQEKLLFEALLHCARNGQLDEVHEYDRPSVRFQQILSILWKATRSDTAFSTNDINKISGDAEHNKIIDDMLTTGALKNVGEALIPADELMDEGDARRIHSVISGSIGQNIIDTQSGEVVASSSNDQFREGKFFIGGRLRSAKRSNDGNIFLTRERSSDVTQIAKLPAVRGGRRGLSRRLVWASAELSGTDPSQWLIMDNHLRTWGGSDYNRLLKNILMNLKIAIDIKSNDFDLSSQNWDSIPNPGQIIILTENYLKNKKLPSDSMRIFREPTRYLRRLSRTMQKIEENNSIPFRGLLKWLGECKSECLSVNCRN